MFSFIKNKLSTIFSQVTSKLGTLFARKKIDEQTLKELELILLTADTGIKTTRFIIKKLQDKFRSGQLQEGQQLKEALKQELLETLRINNFSYNKNSNIFLLVGINGSGKTTFAGKLAYKFAKEGKKVLLVAADTFRAAAPEQLTGWAQKTNTTIHLGKQNQDPASVVFSGCDQFKKENFDVLIIDTAGRLQTKTNLMKELEKIKRVTSKHLPDQKITTLLTVDAMLGQNSFEQAKLFHQATNLNGIVLTKMDGTGKGGIVFSIVQELQIPIAYITFGEAPDKLKLFNAQEYVQELVQ